METIKERAQSYTEKVGILGAYQGYIAGATEQKAIDDAKYKKLRDIAYDMYAKAQYLTVDASGLKESMRVFYHYINFEEEVKED